MNSHKTKALNIKAQISQAALSDVHTKILVWFGILKYTKLSRKQENVIQQLIFDFQT